MQYEPRAYRAGPVPPSTDLIRRVLAALFRVLFRIKLRGMENYPNSAERVLVVANHVSYLDAILLAVFLPVVPVFAIHPKVARWWWAKPFLALVRAFPIDPTRPLAARALIEVIRSGRHAMIFPEGRLTVTGTLMKVYDGPAMIAEKTQALVVPVRLEGVQYAFPTRLKGLVRRRLFPELRLTVLPPGAWACRRI